MPSRSAWFLPLVVGGALLASVPARAQSRTILVVGVADASNGAPVTNAEVQVTDEKRLVHTNWLGEARFPGLNSGMHEVRVRRLGYASSDLELLVQGDSAGVVFMLERRAAQLDTVRTVARRARIESHRLFDFRRQQGLGRYLDEQQLERYGTREFPLVAVSHFPGLMLITGRGGEWQLASRAGSCGVDTSFEELALQGRLPSLAAAAGTQTNQTSGAGGGAQRSSDQTAVFAGSCFSSHPCHVKMFLDDVPVAETDINIIRTEQLYGVEYYAIGDAPPQYRVSGAACGVLLMWSKTYDGS